MILDPRSIPLLLLGGSLFFLWLLRRAWRKKQVINLSGEVRGTDHYQYFLILLGYLLGSVALLIVAIIQVQQTEGWTTVVGYAVAILVLGVIIWQAPKRAKQVLKAAKPPRLLPKLRRRQPVIQVTDAHQWALAAASLLAQPKGRDSTTLAGAEGTPMKRRAAQRWLKKEWDITSEEELDETLTWLFETGHRAEFRTSIGRLSQLLPEEAEVYLAEVAAGKHGFEDEEERAEEIHRVQLVQENTYDIRYMSFLAWDYLRYIELCRVGYLVAWLSETEAQQALVSAAQILQSRYESWEEMGESYLHAREYWSSVEMDRDGQAYQRVFRRLLTEPQSPWQQIAWDLPLYK